MKRKMCLLVCGLLTVGALAGCGSTSDTTADSSAATTDSAETSEDTDAAEEEEEEEKESEADEESTDFDKSSDISVVSREDGSGTRGAFIELFGVEEKDANGEKIDYTTEEAIIANSTEIVMTTVAGDDYAIGYSSLGSLNDTVKAVWIDGAEPTAENINNGSYTIARPFNIATKGDVSEITQDFINYILSADGQAIIEDNGYIKASDAAAFESNGATGKIVIAGSSSVTPVMEKLQEAYQKVNTGAEIEIQESDSTTGMTAAMDGTCDIGMASRELKDTELDGGLTPTVIAKDGIAVIVNKNNPIEELTKDQVNSIFRGDVTTWEEVEE
ncbi:MAG: substrate-binding domain-containing protein [Lachnospiraceae bacterium]|nr:substrate-binding domain-containing protein [Lachnospiraceae bacterium]